MSDEVRLSRKTSSALDAFRPIARSAASDEVMRQLLDQMITRHIRPGERLPTEGELAHKIGVGRNTVREAMKVMEALGLVERRQGDGTYVVDSYRMPFEWLLFPLIARIGTSNDLVELRRIIELGMVELVIEKATEEDFAALESRIRVFEGYGGKEPFPEAEAVAADVSIHVELSRITKNPALVELTRLVMKLFEPSMAAHIREPEGFRESVEYHQDFLRVLRARDFAAAREGVLRSFELWKRYIEL